MKSTVYLYVFDTMADWEIAYITSELNSGRLFKKGLSPLKVVAVSTGEAPITTMGGLKVTPDIPIKECDLEDAAAFILPGGDTWTDGIHDPVLHMAEKYMNNGVVLGAICGATIGLGRAGILNQRYHTSNDLETLKELCPGYIGAGFYRHDPAVTDGNLITASGIAPLNFAVHLFRKLDVISKETMDLWYCLYNTRNPKYYFELMNSIR